MAKKEEERKKRTHLVRNSRVQSLSWPEMSRFEDHHTHLVLESFSGFSLLFIYTLQHDTSMKILRYLYRILHTDICSVPVTAAPSRHLLDRIPFYRSHTLICIVIVIGQLLLSTLEIAMCM